MIQFYVIMKRSCKQYKRMTMRTDLTDSHDSFVEQAITKFIIKIHMISLEYTAFIFIVTFQILNSSIPLAMIPQVLPVRF